MVYRAPLGVPIKPSSDEDHQKSHNCTMDHSFTQFDIPHPRTFDPSSTPRHIGMPLSLSLTHTHSSPASIMTSLFPPSAPMMSTFLDVSAIPDEGFKHKQPLPLSDHHQRDTESHLCQKINLSTIPEESGSYKSSASSSRMTSSSSSRYR